MVITPGTGAAVRYEIVRGPVAARPTAVLTAVTTWEQFPGLWRALLDEVHAGVVRPAGRRPGRNVMLYLDDVPHVEVGIELDGSAELRGRVTRSHLPGGDVVRTVHRGDYGRLGAAHGVLARWCAAEGLRPAGPRWEVYGHWDGDPEAATTEVCWLLGPRSGS
jgi:hypothetical protein